MSNEQISKQVFDDEVEDAIANDKEFTTRGTGHCDTHNDRFREGAEFAWHLLRGDHERSHMQAERAMDASRADDAGAVESIPLTPHEIQSGTTRVKWAEGLIRQLPEDHEGRNSWLLNYAAKKDPPPPCDGKTGSQLEAERALDASRADDPEAVKPGGLRATELEIIEAFRELSGKVCFTSYKSGVRWAEDRAARVIKALRDELGAKDHSLEHHSKESRRLNDECNELRRYRAAWVDVTSPTCWGNVEWEYQVLSILAKLNAAAKNHGLDTAEAEASEPPKPVDKQSTGLYGKFSRIERADGAHLPGRKHHGCDYFVLDLTHDAHAPDAIRAYADSCEAYYPMLARDLRAKLPKDGHRCAEEPVPASPDLQAGQPAWSQLDQLAWEIYREAPRLPEVLTEAGFKPIILEDGDQGASTNWWPGQWAHQAYDAAERFLEYRAKLVAGPKGGSDE